MYFKDPKLKEEFWQLHPKLRMILCEIDWWAKTYGNEDAVITCLIRSEEEQAHLVATGEAVDKTSVHQFGRGADLRLFKSEHLNKTVEDRYNSLFQYDIARPTKKTVMIHNGTARHIHIQVMADHLGLQNA